MRKLILPLILFIAILCGCSKETPVKPETANLSFTVDTIYKNTEYSLTAFTDEHSFLNLTVHSPINLANFKLQFKGDIVRLNYLNLEKEIPLETFEEDSVFRILYQGIYAATKTENLKYDNEEYYIEYSVNQKEFKMIFAGSGLPIEICEENNKNLITFSGISISN